MFLVYGLYSPVLRQSPVACFCDHGMELAGSIKEGQFLD
jgi:hypothetical protein